MSPKRKKLAPPPDAAGDLHIGDAPPQLNDEPIEDASDAEQPPPDEQDQPPEQPDDAATDQLTDRQWVRKQINAALEAFAEIPHRKKRMYLAALAVTGMYGRAADLAGVDRSIIRTTQWADDPLFKAGLKRAQEARLALMEDELYRRAVAGKWKPTGWHKGTPGGFVREHSDLLLMFLMKAHDPKYRDTLAVSGSVRVGLESLPRMPDDVVRRLAAGESAAAVLASVTPQALLQGPGSSSQPVPSTVTDEPATQ